MMRLIALALLAPAVIAGCAQTQVVQEEKPVPVSAEILREADAFLGEAPPPGESFDAYEYQNRAARLVAALAGANPARADKVLRQTVSTVEAQGRSGPPVHLQLGRGRTPEDDRRGVPFPGRPAVRGLRGCRRPGNTNWGSSTTWADVVARPAQAMEARQAEVLAARAGRRRGSCRWPSRSWS